MNAPLHHPLLFEMARSFVTLARTLNLSHAVDQLGSTRQTVRRHIETLEAVMGVSLFIVEDRRYRLTPEGEMALPSALSLISRGQLWLQGQLGHIDGMMRLAYENDDGWSYYQQQQPISEIWNGKSDLLRAAIQGWADSCGHLESEHLAKVRPYALVYRETEAGWICVEVGERSFYSAWWGWANARSSVGRALDQFPGGAEFADIMRVPFLEVKASHSMRLDQVATRVPRDSVGEPVPLAYQRLLMGARMPDGSFALLVFVDRADSVKIQGLDQSMLEQMPADAAVEFAL